MTGDEEVLDEKLRKANPKNLYLGYCSVAQVGLPQVLRFMRMNQTQSVDLRHNAINPDGLLVVLLV